MNAEKKICAECGAELTSDAPQGLCPKCLIKRGLESSVAAAPSSPESKAVADPTPIQRYRNIPTGFKPPNIETGADTTPGAPAGSGKTIAISTADILASSVGARVQYFGDYELLEEIARGGMGVVYKAKQTSLNRIVAVKMILAGQLASEADIRRFHTEAEAAANLQHPNIVAIHEVGEHEGRHYFSMDYVEGKNLAGLVREGPLPPTTAAQLVKTIAEAIQYAHQRGILHRDLKPQNVLMDEHDRPRVTDFGLAKRTGVDSGLTQTGAVMGSPSYMPPEQAAGQHDRVGPASDVYSLGAILYELLTSKAPFVGETPLATLRKVLEEEPTSPSKLNSRVPPDLETICLKCLEKSPERRYATARAVAEELNRFLNDEPIQAKPAGVFRKVMNSVQKRPWLLTGAACSLAMILFGLFYWQWSENKFLVWLNHHPNHVREKGPLSGGLIGWSLLWWGLMSPVIGWFRSYATRERKRGRVISTRILGANAVSGALAITFAFYLLMRGIDAFVWEKFPLQEGFFLGFVLFCTGVGSLVFVFKEYRMATLGIPNTFWEQVDRLEQIRTTRYSVAQIAACCFGMVGSTALGFVPNFPDFDWEHFALGFIAWLAAFIGGNFWLMSRLQRIASAFLLVCILFSLVHEDPTGVSFVYLPLPILLGVWCGRIVFKTQTDRNANKREQPVGKKD